MMASPNGNIFRVTGPLWGESIGDRWIPLQRPVTWTFDFFVWTNSWATGRDTGDLRRHDTHYDVIVMQGNNMNGYGFHSLSDAN